MISALKITTQSQKHFRIHEIDQTSLQFSCIASKVYFVNLFGQMCQVKLKESTCTLSSFSDLAETLALSSLIFQVFFFHKHTLSLSLPPSIQQSINPSLLPSLTPPKVSLAIYI